MAAPDLVIFDCDGVLIDSEVIACRVDAACLAEDGIAITADEIMERYVGLSLTTMLNDLESRYRRRLPADFPVRVRARITAAFEAELEAVPGVADAVRAVTVARCVASSSGLDRLAHTLTMTGLVDLFAPTSSARPRSRAASRRRTCSCSRPNAWASRRPIAW